MATVKEAIYAILQTDAQISGSDHLGGLLGHRSQSPYGIYFMNPPEKPDFPLITYYEIAASGRILRVEGFNFTVWCDDYEAIHELIYDLLHKQSLGTTTGVENVVLEWNWAGPPIFDQNYNILTKIHRYLQYGVKM